MDTGIEGLFRQLPLGIPITFCVSAILMVIVIAYIIRNRQRDRQALATAGAASPAMMDMGSADLPDLDSLSTGEMMRTGTSARSAGPHQVALANGEVIEVVEVFSVLRDVGEGGLIVRIGDKAHRNPPKNADADFMRRFQTALRDLTAPPPTNLTPERDSNAMFQPPPSMRPPAPEPEPVAAVDEPAPSADEPAPVVDEAASAMPDLDDDMPSEDLLTAVPPPLPPLRTPPPKVATGEVPATTAGSLPGDLPKFKMPDGPPVKPKRGQRPTAEPIPEINIAASIEAYLQHKLTQTPQYISRSIHVRRAAHGGVHIEVDGIFYDSVSEVTDADVRQFLAATIEEWQARQ